MQQPSQSNLKILLGAFIGLLVLGVVFIIVSVATLSSDNSLECADFKTGPCVDYWITQDETFCCSPNSIICYAKFYCNGD